MYDKIFDMDIFIINTSDADNVSDGLLKEFEHKKFSDISKRKEHCLSYLMLDRILKEVYKISDRQISFSDGKPFLATKEKYFSISHSADYIAISISGCNCGIDIELIKPRDFKRIASRRNFKSNSLEEFYFDWTKYEAEYKLKTPPKSCKQFRYENYAITAVSENPQETFEILIQNKEIFPNL